MYAIRSYYGLDPPQDAVATDYRIGRDILGQAAQLSIQMRHHVLRLGEGQHHAFVDGRKNTRSYNFV